MGIKRVEAIIRPEKLEPLRILLEELKAPGMMVTEIEGHGKQRGVLHQCRGKTYNSVYVPKVKVEVIVPDKQVKKLVDAIMEVCRSGSVGDGKIFISEIKDAIRIRTKEKGEKAVS